MKPLAQPVPAEIQRIVIFPYLLHRSRHYLLRVIDSGKALSFLQELVDGGLISDGSLTDKEALDRAEGGSCPTNIGFTYAGLRALGLRRRYRDVFREKARAFTEGAFMRGASRLADTGASAPQWWEAPFQHDATHLVLTLHADTDAQLDRCDAILQQLEGHEGLTWINPNARLDAWHFTQDRNYRKVHFGFRDVISDPAVKGIHAQKKKMHEPGEFLLGYQNDNKFNSWLLLNPPPPFNPPLPPLSPAQRRFFWNGSFGVLRKMQQNEKEFSAFVAKWAGLLEVSEEYIRAKMNGRWDHGAPVRLGETEPPDPPAPGADLDDFDFSLDPDGFGCPFGSHIRRMNPREDTVVPARKRPLIRRGMPYGPPYDPQKPDDPTERGLLGLFFCASLEDQFEHLLGEWANANPMGPNNRGTAKDPFIGNHADASAFFDIPTLDEKQKRLRDFTSFVTTRGTLYAFYPSMPALRTIAESSYDVESLAGAA